MAATTAQAPPAAPPVIPEANVTEQVSSIQLALEKNRFAAEKLHASWLGWLKTLSGLVLILSCFQATGPFAKCFKDAEAFTHDHGSSANLTLLKTVMLAFQDNLEYWIAILNSICLMLFLRATKPSFGGAWKVANICMIATVAAFIVHSQKPRTCCIQLVDSSYISPEPPTKKSLPVVVIFHLIASVCIGIIQLQDRIHQRNAAAVEKLKQEVMASKKKK
ncbi:hypothetical protein MPSEU_000305700 [Mayamaea pseudoterrestris]|nr:hypothetical protein MPSEU_000305700 [Mayamaea pseudoterrestris]